MLPEHVTCIYQTLLLALQLVAEGSLQSELNLEAMKWEIRAMGGMLTQNERMLESLRAADAAEASNERDLRHNLQEDARQALGISLVQSFVRWPCLTIIDASLCRDLCQARA